MHVFTLGRPATGPFVTLSWQYSVHATFLATCVLCGNGNGCVAVGRMPKKSLTAAPNVSCAGVYTEPGNGFPSGIRQAPAAAMAHTSVTPARRLRTCARTRPMDG